MVTTERRQDDPSRVVYESPCPCSSQLRLGKRKRVFVRAGAMCMRQNLMGPCERTLNLSHLHTPYIGNSVSLSFAHRTYTRGMQEVCKWDKFRVHGLGVQGTPFVVVKGAKEKLVAPFRGSHPESEVPLSTQNQDAFRGSKGRDFTWFEPNTPHNKNRSKDGNSR